MALNLIFGHLMRLKLVFIFGFEGLSIVRNKNFTLLKLEKFAKNYGIGVNISAAAKLSAAISPGSAVFDHF